MSRAVNKRLRVVKSIHIISSDTISKLGRFFETQCSYTCFSYRNTKNDANEKFNSRIATWRMSLNEFDAFPNPALA